MGSELKLIKTKMKTTEQEKPESSLGIHEGSPMDRIVWQSMAKLFVEEISYRTWTKKRRVNDGKSGDMITVNCYM